MARWLYARPACQFELRISPWYPAWRTAATYALKELALQFVQELERIEQPLAAECLRAVQLVRVPEPRIAQRQDVLPVQPLALGWKTLAGEAVEGVLAPGGGQRLLTAVLFVQPIAESFGDLLAERGAGLQRRHRRIEQDALLVDDLEKRDRRILGVGHPRVRVLVLQQVHHLQDLQALQFRRVMDGAVRRLDALVAAAKRAELVEIRHVLLVGRAELLRAEVSGQLDIDSRLLELGDLVVHPVQAVGVKLGKAVGRLDAGPTGTVRVLVEPHRVDAVLAVERGPLVGQLLLRGTGAVAQIQAPELDRLAVHQQLVALADDPPVFAGRPIEPVVQPDRAGAGVAGGLPRIPACDPGFVGQVGDTGIEIQGAGKLDVDGQAASCVAGQFVLGQHDAGGAVRGDLAGRIEADRGDAASSIRHAHGVDLLAQSAPLERTADGTLPALRLDDDLAAFERFAGRQFQDDVGQSRVLFGLQFVLELQSLRCRPGHAERDSDRHARAADFARQRPDGHALFVSAAAVQPHPCPVGAPGNHVQAEVVFALAADDHVRSVLQVRGKGPRFACGGRLARQADAECQYGQARELCC